MCDKLIKIIFIGDSNVGKSSLFEKYTDNTFSVEDNYAATIGVDFKYKNVEIMTRNNIINENIVNCKLQLWDTAGQERFKSITQSYYRGANICIVCFDASIIDTKYTDIKYNQRSIDSVIPWIEEVRGKLSDLDRSPIPIYVLGLMYDKIINGNIMNDTSNNILLDKIEDLNKMNNVIFIGMCSAKDDMYISNISKSLDKSYMHIITDPQYQYPHYTDMHNINTMFEMIIRHYLENHDISNNETNMEKTIEEISITNQNTYNFCCV